MTTDYQQPDEPKKLKRTPNPPSPGPIGSALPIADGYYWMHNIGSDGQDLWRIVDVGYWTPPTELKLRRAIRDGQRVYTEEYISEWEGIAFHGPLLPPNK